MPLRVGIGEQIRAEQLLYARQAARLRRRANARPENDRRRPFHTRVTVTTRCVSEQAGKKTNLTNTAQPECVNYVSSGGNVFPAARNNWLIPVAPFHRF